MEDTGRQTDAGQANRPAEPATLDPTQARALFAAGLVAPTAGWAAGHAQANVIAVPASLAFEMLLFAQRNPKPCPILDVLEAGEVRGGVLGGDDLASGADIRTDVPLYRVYEHGRLVAEVPDGATTGATTSSRSSWDAPSPSSTRSWRQGCPCDAPMSRQAVAAPFSRRR